MTRQTLAAVGALASVTGMACAQQQHREALRPAGPLTEISPVRIAPATWGAAGLTSVGDWSPYDPIDATPQERAMVFDCIRNTGDCDVPGWFFGTGYCNMFVTNDMMLHPLTDLARGLDKAEIAWYWTVNGSFSSERCIIGIFTQESVPCEPDSFDYTGWLFDFGTLPSGGFYYAEIDLIDQGVWAAPMNGVGSYREVFLSEVTSSGAWVLATCAQPMLWGTGDVRGDPAAPGTQGPQEFDDDVFLDGSHTSSECYTYSYSSICPSILGAAMGFWGYFDPDACTGPFPDCDGNSTVDTRDFLCFLGKWAAASHGGGYDPDADCNGDGAVDAEDFLCFLNTYVACAG